MNFFGATNKGAVRKENQDSYSIRKIKNTEDLVVLICDGMGGANAGGFASRIANREFCNVFIDGYDHDMSPESINALLCTAAAAANSMVYDYSAYNPELAGMGTTLVGGLVRDDGECFFVNIGDSRAYHYHSSDDSLRQISSDHSLVYEMVQAGILTPEEAAVHPKRNVITRAVGTEAGVRPDLFRFTMEAGSAVVLCSDGLINAVSEDFIKAQVSRSCNAERQVSTLVNETLKNGAPDNVTVIIIHY